MNDVEERHRKDDNMRDITRWAVIHALAGYVPNYQRSYKRDNTIVQASNTIWWDFGEVGHIPWQSYSRSTYRHTTNVLLWNNSIIQFEGLNGRIDPEHPTVQWTMAGHDSVTTRERLTGFGINLVRKRGVTYWHKPDGTVERVDPNETYHISAKHIIEHLVRIGLLPPRYLDFYMVIRNKRRRLQPTV